MNMRQSGLSLIEIIITLTIITIITTISVPIYQSIGPTLALRATTRDLASDLRLAQQRSVTEQIIYAVSFDIDNGRYEIINTVSSSTIQTKLLHAQISIATTTGLTDQTVRFTATGAAIESGTIVLTHSDGASSTISIKPSGYVKIEE